MRRAGTHDSAKERPILFSGPLIRALLAGTKTQTRRLAKPLLGSDLDAVVWHAHEEAWRPWLVGEIGDPLFCPYGVPGDRLWVRETIHRGPPQGAGDDSATYAADGAFTDLDAWPWKANHLPSIHMPRGLSRITLEVTGVRCERLQDITEEDAKAEGVPDQGVGNLRVFTEMGANRYHFATLWDQINGKRANWMSNPWVWVVSFKRVQC